MIVTFATHLKQAISLHQHIPIEKTILFTGYQLPHEDELMCHNILTFNSFTQLYEAIITRLYILTLPYSQACGDDDMPDLMIINLSYPFQDSAQFAQKLKQIETLIKFILQKDTKQLCIIRE
jgi:hypothetical protein